LCDAFPRLFDLIDNSDTGELDAVPAAEYQQVADACTLCDMCFMTKCPYVPPHEFNVDFPHVMLRYRAVEFTEGKVRFARRELGKTDRNGELARFVAPLANWGSDRHNGLTRPVLEKLADIDRNAELPKYHGRTFVGQAKRAPPAVDRNAPAAGRKAVLYATCFVNYNKPATGMAARAVLNHIGVETRAAYPGCCGMPFLEQAELDRVAAQAVKVSRDLCALIDQGYDIVTLTASCGLMLKFEWPLILPDNENVKKLAKATFDIDEYVIDISKRHGLPDGLKPLPEGISVHMACHARAQNMGAKAAELLRLIPDTPIDVIERCAGHGGTFGVLKETHSIAMKVGKPVMRSLVAQGRGHVVSDCPLAGKHIVQGAREIAEKDGNSLPAKAAEHPIEVFAHAYGLI
jgi:glycerol-3-phosphate dehydrogenase subunit C